MRVRPFQKSQSLAKCSTFGIGGAAKLFTQVESIEELQEVLIHCHQHRLPFFVVGKGSNSLFDDRGFDGLVIQNKIADCHFQDKRVDVGAGYSFSLLGSQTARKGFSGLEFASGIPGSVGGAVFMNAGAGGHEVCDVLDEVVAVDGQGNVHRLKKEEVQFAYRWSSFHDNRWVIASASFHLTPSGQAKETQSAILQRRLHSQPYSDKSCGCVFRNHSPSQPAGALIERAGLKGEKRGGAEVSTLHANFIVNKGGATAQEVLALANYVQKTVQEKTGILLEMELRIVPYMLEDVHVSR